MSDKPLYVTTAIAYANAEPHIGHAFEFVLADAYVRSMKKRSSVYFVTGMDEHGQKIEQKAREAEVPVQEFVNRHAESFKNLDKQLSVGYDFFVRTSDTEKHYVGATALWNKLVASGDIEKRIYKALYCVGCEEFKTEKDLNEKGECPAHLKVPETIEEENYFFTLSKYTERIKEKILSRELDIVPDVRRNEILALLERGLEDVSFSRPTSKVSWGIPVPGDDSQVMYVWCDALSNYITAIGYGTDTFDEAKWSNAVHVIGKDILRFHAAIWPGMLMSAGLALPKKILVHGHITSGGQKMSKTLGNVISPRDVVDTLLPGAGDLSGEAARFVLLHEIPSFEDGDMTLDSLKVAYTAYLANGIGNLTSRIMRMVTTNAISFDIPEREASEETADMNAALKSVMARMRDLDEYIATKEPFKVIKMDVTSGEEMLRHCGRELAYLAQDLSPFMPETSRRILSCITDTKMPETPLFARLS